MRTAERILFDNFAADDGNPSFDEFKNEMMNDKDYQLILQTINDARKEALKEAADKCGIGLPTFWAVQNAIKDLIKELK